MKHRLQLYLWNLSPQKCPLYNTAIIAYHSSCSFVFVFGSQKHYFMLSPPSLNVLHHTVSKLAVDDLASFFVEKNRSHQTGTSCFPPLPIYNPGLLLLSEANATCALNSRCSATSRTLLLELSTTPSLWDHFQQYINML